MRFCSSISLNFTISKVIIGIINRSMRTRDSKSIPLGLTVFVKNTINLHRQSPIKNRVKAKQIIKEALVERVHLSLLLAYQDYVVIVVLVSFVCNLLNMLSYFLMATSDMLSLIKNKTLIVAIIPYCIYESKSSSLILNVFQWHVFIALRTISKSSAQ